MLAMRRSHITKAGQLSVPVSVRRRWETDWVLLEDHGDHLVIRPTPADPIAAARGSLKGRLKHTSDELRRLAREDERRAEERKWGRF